LLDYSITRLLDYPINQLPNFRWRPRMKRTVIAPIAIVTAAIGVAASQGGGQPPAARGNAPARPGLTLTTSAFTDGGEIPQKYTQAAHNPVSPKLEWTNVPDGTHPSVLNRLHPATTAQRKTDTVIHRS